MEENIKKTTLIQNAEKFLQEKIDNFKTQKKKLVNRSILVFILLFLFLCFIFIVFSIEIKFIHLDSNSISLLWIFVILDIIGMVCVVVRAFRQMKHYKTCVTKLDVLKLKISVKEQDSDKKLCEEEIYKELKEILQEL